jgi:hypothetical protein
MALRPVGFAAVRVALHRGAHSRVTSFREREQVPGLLSGGGVWFRLRWVLVVVA